LPSEYDAAGYTYRLGMFEDGRRRLVMRAAIALECPVRLLHGMQDTAVPWETSLSLAERLQSSDVAVTLVKDGDHRLSREADLAPRPHFGRVDQYRVLAMWLTNAPRTRSTSTINTAP
jgi:alpha-beta hydrolase superfamily lysophospholipase